MFVVDERPYLTATCDQGSMAGIKAGLEAEVRSRAEDHRIHHEPTFNPLMRRGTSAYSVMSVVIGAICGPVPVRGQSWPLTSIGLVSSRRLKSTEYKRQSEHRPE